MEELEEGEVRPSTRVGSGAEPLSKRQKRSDTSGSAEGFSGGFTIASDGSIVRTEVLEKTATDKLEEVEEDAPEGEDGIVDGGDESIISAVQAALMADLT